MTISLPVMQRIVSRQCTAIHGTGPKTAAPRGTGSYSRRALPTDAIGNTTVTFSGIQADTEIRVYLPDGTELTGIESCAANQVLSWPVYAPGANSTMYITLLKRGYRWQRFNYAPVVGAQTIPIFQITDLGYSNPA